MISPRLQTYFDDYVFAHQTPGNQLTHTLGIPFILVSLLGLLSHLNFSDALALSPYFRLDGGTLLIFVVLPFYTYLDWKITGPYALVLFGLYFLGRALPSPVCWILFTLGWILQGIGHAHYEKKSPAFYRNLIHLLIGPLWIFCKILILKPPKMRQKSR